MYTSAGRSCSGLLNEYSAISKAHQIGLQGGSHGSHVPLLAQPFLQSSEKERKWEDASDVAIETQSSIQGWLENAEFVLQQLVRSLTEQVIALNFIFLLISFSKMLKNETRIVVTYIPGRGTRWKFFLLTGWFFRSVGANKRIGIRFILALNNLLSLPRRLQKSKNRLIFVNPWRAQHEIPALLMFTTHFVVTD